MGLSIVICTHNRAEWLRRTLDSIDRAAKPQALAVEILVVANACRDSTHRMLETMAANRTPAQLPLRWLEERTPGKSHALNLAIRESRNETLCFIDDDQFVDEQFLPVLEEALLRYPEFGIYCGHLFPAWDGSEPSWVHERGEYMIPIRPFPEYDLGDAIQEVTTDMKIPSGGNIIVRREVFARVGDFSTDLGPTGHNLMGGEDQEFLLRASSAAVRVLYLPALRQLHAIDQERMSHRYMLKKSYLRTYSKTTLERGNKQKFYLYQVRKLSAHLFKVVTAGNANRRFYWLMRCAATLGELRGQLHL